MQLQRDIRADGLAFAADADNSGWLADPYAFGAQAERVALLAQIEEQGFTHWEGDRLVLPWPAVYRLVESAEYTGSVEILGLPAIARWRPILASQNTLTDPTFAIVLTGWLAPDGQPAGNRVQAVGAVLTCGAQTALLPKAAWETVDAIRAFHQRPTLERTPEANRLAWARIRGCALAAGARLDNFLTNTVVLTPQRLKLRLRRGAGRDDALVEVIPGFEGEPARWVEIFDRVAQLQTHYQIPDGTGLTHVVVSPEVRQVLAEIKRMPGRRVAGERAQAFVRNPFALLGPDAEGVIDAEEFEQARQDAGISFCRFTECVERAESGRLAVSLLVEEALGETIRSEKLSFQSPDELDQFIAKLELAMARGAVCCVWEGYELDVLGDAPERLEALKTASDEWRAPQRITAAEIFDLSRYTERIEKIGRETSYYSPFIARHRDGEGWFPENVQFGLRWTPDGGGEPVHLAMDKATLERFRQKVDQARAEGRSEVLPPGFPRPISLPEAEAALSTLGEAMADVAARRFDPERHTTPRGPAAPRSGLVIKPNIEQLDYEERRAALREVGELPPKLPGSLKQSHPLLEHQEKGLAWLQGLWSQAPTNCRGALLADDMGLGKTLQLLAFLAELLETKPGLDPILVVAPVALLDNWRDEMDKFFAPGTFPTLTLYGPDLAAHRQPMAALDQELAAAGIVHLLQPGWLGNHRVVLTTYETLRDFELPLAQVRWSVMVCDEAQKIKNPNAMMARSAKKQNALFKVACTGTPVENSLTDLWNLFDFIQPGLLGSLKEFGTLYRRPIEAKTDAQKARVEQLRGLIAPQTLRRTKAEVARALPHKIEAPRSLPLSDFQRAHYAHAVSEYRGAQAQAGAHLRLLQYLRRLCSDPRPMGQAAPAGEPLDQVHLRSPKMAWLVTELEAIRGKGEKAIVFCEFRDLQRLLQRAIRDALDFTADIVNGSTTAAAGDDNGRYRRIRKFQERPGFGVIILSPLAVGFGLNIQAANHVIHFTRHWNPAREDQATDRAYRIGQTRDVYVHYPMVVGGDFKTFDEKLHELLLWKRELSQDMLNGAGDLNAADFADIEAPDGAPAFEDAPVTLADVQALDGRAFELFCVALWEKQGFRVVHTPQSGDGGVDVVALGEGIGELVQCKSSLTEGAALGPEAIQEVVAGAPVWSSRFPSVSFARVAVTNRRFGPTARQLADSNEVRLVEETDIAQLLARHPVNQLDIQRMILAAAGQMPG